MDLNAIELTEAVTGEAILSPGHYGHSEPVVLDVITTDNSTGKRSSDDPYPSDESEVWVDAPDDASYQDVHDWEPVELDDPQPEPCVECDGSGRSQITTRGHVVPINCPHCLGEGAVEADV